MVPEVAAAKGTPLLGDRRLVVCCLLAAFAYLLDSSSVLASGGDTIPTASRKNVARAKTPVHADTGVHGP
jgi:hypothetical protein